MRHAFLSPDHAIFVWRALHMYWNCFHVAAHQWICPLPFTGK